MIEHIFPPEMMKEREKQLISALLDCASVYYDINITQDRIIGTPIQVVDGVEYDILAQIGFPKNCRYSDIVHYWAGKMPSEEVGPFVAFSEVEHIKQCYEMGAEVISHKFWTYDVLGNRMLAEQKIRLYQDQTTGDLLGLVYVSNGDKYDTLQRKEAQLAQDYQAATHQVDFLQAMATSIPGGYHRCGISGGFSLEFVSDSFVEIVGWTREEIQNELNNEFIRIVAPEDRERFMRLEPQLVRDGKISCVYRVQRKDGSYRWVQDDTMHIAQDGQEYYQCTLADITDFVKQQEDLTRQNLDLYKKKNMLEAIEQSMPGGYHRCAAQPGFPFLYFGTSFEEITGWTRQEIEEDFDNLFANMVFPEDLSLCANIVTDVEKYGYSNAIYRMKKKGGGYIWVADSTMKVEIGDDHFYQGVLADVTKQIEEMEQAKKAAEASSLAKSSFLFNASHDIRTPMNAIQGFAHIINENTDNPALVKQTVQKILHSSSMLMTLLNDVLELSRIERGKDNLNLRPLNMISHVEKLNEMMTQDMGESGILFRMENHIQHPFVIADDLKLTRIAMNLLSNAKEFTPAGGTVTFGVNETGYDGKQAVYNLIVEDTGIGMSEEFLNRAFEQFERERSSTDSGVSGSGLGLSITKSIVELVGGHCSIESQLGKGTKVTCAVPLSLAREEDLQPVTEKIDMDFSGMRILLVEDNEFNREIAKYVFEEVGFLVEEAENGVICLEKLLDSHPGHYDFILMDMQMPIMDGLTATREIRQLRDPVLASIPIIAMTANAFHEDKQKCLDAGMNGHISKPLDAKAVMNEFMRVLY